MVNVNLLGGLGGFLVIYETVGKTYGVIKPWGLIVNGFLLLSALLFSFWVLMRSMHDVDRVDAVGKKLRNKAKRRELAASGGGERVEELTRSRHGVETERD